MKCLLLILGCLSGALAQKSDLTQLPASTDSTLQARSTPEQYDYYYSQKQADQFVKMSRASYTRQDQIIKHRFRDKTYTQVVAKGLTVGREFDDYILIGTGSITEAKQNGEW